MKTQKSMLTAFLLNLFFSLFEFFGGMVSGSYAITSDALHDLGDAVSIGVSILLEGKSKKSPDEKYTYGYGAFSLVGALFTTSILIAGSILIISGATRRIINPIETNHEKMLIFAIIGVAANSISAFVTNSKDNANIRAVNLHMLEDVLGWLCVLLGAVIIHFTKLHIIDPVLSIAVSLYILFHAVDNIKDIFSVFLHKVPDSINISDVKKELMKITGITDIHHLHIWACDQHSIISTLHVVTDENPIEIKKRIREELIHFGITHVTAEFERSGEICNHRLCTPEENFNCQHHSH